MFDYSSFTNAVIEANKELYEYMNIHMSSLDLKESETIGFGGDNSLQIDLIAENIFIKHLNSFGDIFSEEIGLLSSKSNIKIVIDPIDGSHNLQSGLSYYGTSVALKIDDKTKAGYVCNLVNKVMIYKVNDDLKQIDIISKRNIEILEVKNSAIGIFERAYSYPTLCEKLYRNKLKFRSPGAVAISLAYAKNYNFVIFVGNIREFDVAASLYICNDLLVHQEDEFIVVSKNDDFFTLLKNLLMKNRL